jgi:hypothetical protein
MEKVLDKTPNEWYYIDVIKRDTEVIKMAKLTDAQIDKLVKLGARRWTNYGKDRLYVTEKLIGLEVDRYGTGNISYAELNGEKISNSYARDIVTAIGRAYIDCVDGSIVCGRDALDLVKTVLESI